MRRWLLALAAMAGAVAPCLAAGPAAAHEQVPGVAAVLDAVSPPVPGVTIQVRISAADQVVVDNPTPALLEVFGRSGEPFLRIGPDGTAGNARSPSFTDSLNPEGAVLPPDADPAAPPRWVPLSRDHAWGWFDHRLHPAAITRAPGPPSAKVVQLGPWEIPMRYDGHLVSVRGHREFRPPLGSFHAALRVAPKGVRVDVLPGVVPALFARLDGARQIEIAGPGGEPFARLGPGGADVNEASPAWTLTAQSKGTFRPDESLNPAGPPQWRHVDDRPQLVWLESRTAPAVRAPPNPDRAQVTRRWTIPVTVDGRPSPGLTGTTDWVPFKPSRSRTIRVSSVLIAVVTGAVAGGIAGGAAMWVRRTRRGTM